MSTQASAIYVGRLAHVRRTPKPHAFAYRLHMLYLDLDELPALCASGCAIPFRSEDYGHDPKTPLADQIRERVEGALGIDARGPVRLLTQVRSLGYVFNPVSFYYCFAPGGEELRAVVAEITNTPWGERHSYVLRAGPSGVRAGFAKAFHVSPFFPMGQTYQWRLSVPSKSLTVSMENYEGDREVFRARLALLRRPLTASALRRTALTQPLMSWKVHAAIYWQALRLWLKGEPFFSHPAKARPVERKV